MQLQTICATVGVTVPRRAEKHYATKTLAALAFVEDCTAGPDCIPVELLADAAAVVLQHPDVLAATLTMYLHNL